MSFIWIIVPTETNVYEHVNIVKYFPSYLTKVAHRLDIPEELSQIHNTFYVSQLWTCLADDSAVVPLDDIHVDERLNYVEKPIATLDMETKTLRNKVVGLEKVQ